MKNIKALLVGCALLGGIVPFQAMAQSCGNDSIYNLPYKDTYVKEPLVAENTYRIAKPRYLTPKSFEEAQQILPAPIWLPGTSGYRGKNSREIHRIAQE